MEVDYSRGIPETFISSDSQDMKTIPTDVNYALERGVAVVWVYCRVADS